MRASGYAPEDNGFYQEPAWFVDALLAVEDFSAGVYDPFCGEGTIPQACARHGIDAIGSDIADRGYGAAGLNFFDIETVTSRNIVSNPDYAVLQEAIDHALLISACKVAIVARLAFLASQRRRNWFLMLPLARVWIASQRPSMPPGGKGIKAKGGTIEYCWLVFEPGHVGKPIINWLPIVKSPIPAPAADADPLAASLSDDNSAGGCCAKAAAGCFLERNQ